MVPVIIPVPSGNWGMGPSLLYLFGIIGVLIYAEWDWRRLEGPTAEEQARAAMRKRQKDDERAKDELFTRLLIEAANERRGRKPGKGGE